MKARCFAGLPRRAFLLRCCQAAGTLFLPAGYCTHGFARSSPQLHLEPHYRQSTLLDAALTQIKPDLDAFVTERRHHRLAPILNSWSASLLQSPRNTSAIERSLSPSFRGTGWQPAESHLLRPASGGLEAHRLRFTQTPALNSQLFGPELAASLDGFSTILTAEFQLTAIEAGPCGLATRVRYELVGTGKSFHRDGRTGEWSLDWETDPEYGYRVVKWSAGDEIRARSSQPCFEDISAHAFSGCSSWQSHLSHRADYWRTVLDGASGMDIYGHNGVSCGDIDGSGHDSVYICQPAGLPNRLYRNRGDGTFEDVTEASGLASWITPPARSSPISATPAVRIWWWSALPGRSSSRIRVEESSV